MKALRVIFAIFAVLAVAACGGSPDIEPVATEAAPGSVIETPSEREPQTAQGLYLERVGEDMGVIRDADGHLFVEGRAAVQFLRLLSYFNAEARSEKSDDALSYKISGFYGAGVGQEGYTDTVSYSIQISSDEFSTPVNLDELARELQVGLSDDNYLLAEHESPYDALDALLTYLNAEAANAGRDYKFKAWYDTHASDGVPISERVDIVVHFSFDEKFHRPTTDLAIYARTLSPTEQRQKSVIANAAVNFSQLLEEPGVISILSLDFSGDTEQGPPLVYLFEGKDIEILHDIREGRKDWGMIEILSLAEVKEPRGRSTVSGAPADESALPEEKTNEREEPIGQEVVEVVARIAVETARVLNPTNLEITIYEFEGSSPNSLTTWSYRFDKEDVKILRSESMSSESILRLASIVERIAVIPGGRIVPYIQK